MKLILFLLTALLGQNVLSETVFTYFVSDKASMPIQMYDTNKQKASGIMTDIINEVKSDHIPIKAEVLPFKRMIREMKYTDKHWLAYGSKAWSGPQMDNLSDTTIIRARHVFFTNKNYKISSIDDLFGKKVVLIKGLDYPGLEDYIEEGKITAVYVKDHQAAIFAVLRRRGVAFPEMDFRLLYHLNKHFISDKSYSIYKVKNTIEDYDINLSFSKNFPDNVKKTIEQRVETLKRDGTLLKIMKKYAPGYEN